MIAEMVNGKAGYRSFAKLQREVYRDNASFRGTEATLEKMLILGPTVFHEHAEVKPFLLKLDGRTVGRFALIHDSKLPEVVQVSFFEALPGLGGILAVIREAIARFFPRVRRMVVGLNGHLNYGAGFLLDQFGKPPVFGLPYSQDYYPDYFQELQAKKMVSFNFPVKQFGEWSEAYHHPGKMKGLRLRFMDKRRIRRDIAIYTWLNNQSFQQHPYWADRTEAEDFELFYPFRFLLDNENLIIAEYQGKPVGFFLWYPDFNQMVSSPRDLNLWDVLRYRWQNPIRDCRLTEIGVVPDFQGSPVALAMIEKGFSVINKGKYNNCEVGFIFEENRPSAIMCRRLLTRCGLPAVPHRQYAVYEGSL